MTRTRIYLVRHGQVEGFEEKRYNGQGDVRLTPEGEALHPDGCGASFLLLKLHAFLWIFSRCRKSVNN